MKKIVIIFIFITLVSCSGNRFEDADAFISGLSNEQKVGQLLIFAVPGQTIKSQNRDLIEKYNPGGIIYFGYNIKNSSQLLTFTTNLQRHSMKSSGIPLFISIDQEGGRVVRIKDGVTAFPGNLASAIASDTDDVYTMALITALELKKIGINMNLAPDLDVNNNPQNPVINTRSFGSDPEIVAKMGRSYIRGLKEGRCISVAKHFPGHGDTNTDSHYSLPVIKHGIKRLKKVELVPFYEAVSSGVECIMTAHICFPSIISTGEPATLSPYFLTWLLREDMKFTGIIMTDDMEMNAISLNLNLGKAALKSFLAGTDIILISSYGKNISLIYNTLINALKDGVISQERLDRSVRKIIEMKLRYGIMDYDSKTGKTEKLSFILNDNQKEIIKEGPELNRKISKKAIYYFGTGKLYKKQKNNSILYISNNKTFRESIRLSDDDILLNGTENIFAIIEKKIRQKSVKVIYQTHHIDKKTMEALSKKLNSRGVKFFIVYTGNPYLLADWKSNIPILFTFSNTEESLKQAAKCLNGDFEPIRKINSNIGFRH